MGHEISINGSELPEMAYAGAKPWHGLGTQVPGTMTSTEALVASRLNWEVQKVQVTSPIDGQLLDDHHILYRNDTKKPLSVVGNSFTPIQNHDIAEFFDMVLGEGQGQIETIGALFGGRSVWAMAKMPEEMEVVAGDKIERYLVISNEHSSFKTCQIYFTDIRVVCNNTLTASVKGAKSVHRVRHLSSYQDRLAEVAVAIADHRAHWMLMKQTCKLLAETSVTRVEVGVFLDAVFPGEVDELTGLRKGRSRGRERVEKLIETGIGTDIVGVRGTAWGLYNAYTEWLDHERPIRSEGGNWAYSNFGYGAQDRQRAFDTLLTLIG